MELTTELKEWALGLSGKELFNQVNERLQSKQFNNQLAMKIYAFWLNQHNLRHDQAYFKARTTQADKSGRTEFIVQNRIEPRLYWEKHDPDLSTQSIKNEFQTIWNRNLNADVDEVFS